MDNRTEKIWQPHKSSIFGLDANVMAMLSFLAAAVVGWIPFLGYVSWLAPLVIFFVEKNSPLVRKNAMQAFVIQLLGQAVSIVISLLSLLTTASFVNVFTGAAMVGTSFIFALLLGIVNIIVFIFEIIAMIKAYKYKEYHIPVVGKIADWAIHKLGSQYYY